MQIRKMTIADYDEVYSLWLSCEGMGLNRVDDTKDGISRFLERNPDTCFIAEKSGEIIGARAFYNCNSLESINMPGSVTSIGSYAFLDCTSLESVIIGNSVTSIGSGAFRNCSSLNTVYYTGTAEDWSSISINGGNTYLTDATRYYYSESEPEEEGNYWHYVDGEIVIWTKE